MIALLLAGCWVTPSEADLKLGATGDTLVVVPRDGSTAGGTQVVITQLGLGKDVSVDFGGTPGTILRREGDSITVLTPEADEGSVVVDVTVDGQVTTLPDAFTYWAEGTGKIGAVGELAWYHYQGSYWGGEDPSYGSAWLGFVRPSTDSYDTTVWGSDLDDCVVDYVPDSLAVYPPGSGNVNLLGASGPMVALSPQQDLWQATFTADSWPGADDWDVELQSDALPRAKIGGLLATPEGFDITSPDVGGSDPPIVAKNSFDLAWEGPYTGDEAVAWIQLGSTGSVVTCRMTDDGSFSVPASALDGWSKGSSIVVAVGRVVRVRGTLPWNRSFADLAGTAYAVGQLTAK